MDKKTDRIIYTAVFIVCMLAGVIACISKKAMHEDEFYSFYSSNRTWGLAAEGEVTSEDILRELEVLPGEGFNFSLVREVQSWDVHPPVYYFCLHLVCSVTAGIFSMWQGLGINLFCLAVCLILMKKLGSVLMPGAQLVTDIAVLAWGLSAATLTGAVFIRMYMLLSVWILAITMLHVVYGTTGRLDVRFVIGLFLLTFLGFMTHYYFLVWLIALAAVWNIMTIINTRGIRASLIYAGVELMCAVCCYLFYPAFPAQMFRGQRGAQAAGNFINLSNTLERISFFAAKINRIGFGSGLWIVLGFMVVYFCLLKDRRRLGLFSILLGIPVLLYFLIVSKTALMLGDSSIRYHMPVIGIVYLLIGYILLDQKISPSDPPGLWRGIVPVAALAFLAVLNLTGDLNGRISFLYPETEDHLALLSKYPDAETIYAYPSGQSWIMWADATELLGFDSVYYVPVDELVRKALDSKLLSADKSDIHTTATILYLDVNTDIDSVIGAFPGIEKKTLLYSDSGGYTSVYLLE